MWATTYYACAGGAETLAESLLLPSFWRRLGTLKQNKASTSVMLGWAGLGWLVAAAAEGREEINFDPDRRELCRSRSQSRALSCDSRSSDLYTGIRVGAVLSSVTRQAIDNRSQIWNICMDKSLEKPLSLFS